MRLAVTLMNESVYHLNMESGDGFCKFTNFSDKDRKQSIDLNQTKINFKKPSVNSEMVSIRSN
jgi:hypothetical protein